ncbi:MAG: leucine-rich repeat domain-containing protein, partial [Clostridia bacterium]|nr:leucine-rich repeat domain-containing protein [Clostridia bacterium]
MKKTLLSILLALALILPFGYATSFPVFAAETRGTTGGCTWTLSGTVLTISGNGAMADYIYYSTAPWGKAVTEVVIEDGVTSIGNYAFHYCTNLTSITIPDSITSIGDAAFQGCYVLSHIPLHENIRSIGAYAFADCFALSSLSLPCGITNIREGTFYNCSSLSSLSIPDTVTTIGTQAFSKCIGLKSIELPNSVTTLESSAFMDCTALTSVSLSNRIETLSKYAFYRCSSLSSIVIPKGIAVLDECVFYECPSLTSITIPDTLTFVGYSAFYDTKLSDVWYEGKRSASSSLQIDSNNNEFHFATWHYVDNGCDTTCNDCSAVRQTTHSPENGVCTVCGKEFNVAPVSAKLVLDQYIGVKFYFNKADVDEKFTYFVTLPGKETPLAEGRFYDLTEEDDLFVLFFNGIGLSDFETEFTLSGATIRDPNAENYNSIMKLALLGEKESTDEKAVRLFQSIADLGLVANGKDAEFGLSYKAITPASSGKGAEEGAKISFTGKNLVMNDAVGIRLYATCTNYEDIWGIKIIIDGKKNITSLCSLSTPLYNEEIGKYTFYVDMYFSVSTMEGTFTLSITDGDGNQCLTLCDSVDWIAQSIINKESENTLAKQVLI